MGEAMGTDNSNIYFKHKFKQMNELKYMNDIFKLIL
jgi:hypothetical protein